MIDSSHWYKRDGSPFYTVKSKTGVERAATKADARKVDAVPSVSTILKCVPKPGLDSWKLRQVLMASLTLPQRDGELADDYARRVMQDADEHMSKAADKGTAVHDAIEAWLIDGTMPAVTEIRDLFIPWRDWWVEQKLTVVHIEESMCHEVNGYGGRIDLVASHPTKGLILLDWKTQEFKKGAANFYDTWPIQLEAYARMTGYRISELWSVAISSTVPMPPQVRVWPNEKRDEYWQVFQACQRVWEYANNYYPSKFLNEQAAEN